MKFAKKICCLLVAGAMLLPYTAIAESRETYGYGKIYDISPSYYSTAFSLQAENGQNNAPLADNEIELLEYIADNMSSFKDKIEGLEKFNVSANRFLRIYSNYISQLLQLEHPELYYVDLAHEYRYGSIDGKASSVNVYYTMTKQQHDTTQAMIDKEINAIVTEADKLNSDLERVLYVHDYIVANYSYDTTYQSRTLDTMIAQKTGVCQGYAHLFFTVMQKLGIKCINVPNIYNAEIEAGHVWNKVMIDNEWFNIDLTYDDPISYFGTSSTHNYFLLTDEQIKIRDDETGQSKNEHVKMETKMWDGVTDMIPATADTSKFWGFQNIAGATAYKDNIFWGLNSDGDICKIKFEGNIVVEPRYKQTINYIWRIWDYGMYGLNGRFYGLLKYDGRIFYNTTNAVYEFNTANETLNPVYMYNGTLNECETYFYGLSTDGSKLYADYCETHLNPESGELSFENIRKNEIPVEPQASEEPTPEPTEEPTPEPTEEPTPEPTEEPFPVFEDNPTPCEVNTDIVPVTVEVENEEGEPETIEAQQVTVSVDIPTEIQETVTEFNKPITVSVAKYSDGAFVGFEEITLENNTATFIAGNDCDSIKTFVWAGFIMPLAMAEAIGLAPAPEPTASE